MLLRNYKQNLSFWTSAKKSKIHKIQSQETVTFQGSLKLVLFIGQLFSLFPVAGLLSNDANKVKFVPISWKCGYSMLSMIGQLFIIVMCILYVAHFETTLNGTTPIIFYGVTFISMIAFVRASRRWPELIQHISKSEELDPSFDFRLKKKCNITLLFVLVLAILEHIFSIRSAYSASQICYPHTGFYEGFVRYLYPWVFDFLPYSAALGMVTQFLNIQSHFIWNFTDLFVICMSYYLTSRLDLVNKKLLPAQGKYLPEIFWRTTRETYCRATKLVRKVDEIINGILFISFANNLFFVCVQLFNTFEIIIIVLLTLLTLYDSDSVDMVGLCYNYSERRTKPVGREPVIYLLFSLGFLISRSIAVSLIASQVNLASTVPAPILYDVPSAVYCVEVQRFLEQVNGDNVALTGLQFFSVTRGLLLSVAGTIVTYELVMVQFNQAPASDSFTEKLVENNITTIETFYNYS